MNKLFRIDPGYDPQRFVLPCGDGPNSADRKAPPADVTYPDLGKYRRIDPAQYYSAAHMQLEKERLWSRVWTCAGRESDVARRGQFFTYDLGTESFIITRGDDGVRAFYNACQHRGRRLVDAASGSRVQFMCPFHSWTYDLAGNNTRVTDRETFSPDALCGDLSLKQARCEMWGGFVFVNMDPDAPPLMEFLGEIPELMKNYRMEEMHIIKDTMVEIDCNWKAGEEAFLETYHIHITHPQTLPGVDDVYEQIDAYANGHGRIVTPFAAPSPRVDDGIGMSPFLGMFLANAGLDPTNFVDNRAGIRDAIWQAKRAPDNKYGLDYSAFTKSQVLDIWAYSVFPNFTLNAHPEGVLTMRFLPHATDPEKFYFQSWLIAPKLKEGVKLPFYMGVEDDVDISGANRPPRRHMPMADTGLGLVMDQDIANLCAVQKGLRSHGMKDGNRYSEEETRLQVLHAEIDAYLSGSK